MIQKFYDEYNRWHYLPVGTVPESRCSVYGLVINPENKILLVKLKSSKLWGLPGGRKDNGESDFEALNREMIEEANIELLNNGQLIYQLNTNFFSIDSNKYFYNLGNYYKHTEFREVKADIECEIEEYAWFNHYDISGEMLRGDHLVFWQKNRKKFFDDKPYQDKI